MYDLYEKIREHVDHKVVSISYAEGDNVAIECEKCNAVIVDASLPEEGQAEAESNPSAAAAALQVLYEAKSRYSGQHDDEDYRALDWLRERFAPELDS